MSIGCSGKGMFNRLFFVQYLVIGLFFLGFSSQLMAAADITVKVYESGSSLKVEVSGSITKAGWGSPTKYSDEDSGGGYTEMYKSNGQHIFGWASSGLHSRWYYEPTIQTDDDFNFGTLSHPGPAGGSVSGSPSSYFSVYWSYWNSSHCSVVMPTEGTTSVNATMTFPNTSFADVGYPADGFDKIVKATNGDELIRFWVYVPPVAPTVTTSAATNVGATSARMNGAVTSLGIPAELDEYGFVYDTSSGPTTSDTKIDKGTKTTTGSFNSTVTGLTKNTTYYYKSYAINAGGTSYGAEKSFTTPNIEDQTITFNALAAKTYGDANFNLAATASSGLAVSYASSNTNVATISGSTVTIVGAGSTTITASQAGNENYNPAPNVQRTLTVNKKGLTVTASADSMTYDGSSYSGGNGVTYDGFATGDDSGDLGGTLSYAGDSQGATNAGSYTITPQGYSSDDYTISYTNGTLTINKKALTITANADSKTYGETKSNGAGFVDFVSSGLVGAETIGSVSVAYGASSAATADVGTYSDHITISAATGGTFNANNYTISYEAGDLTVNKRDLTISAFTAQDKTYDATTTATADTSTWTTNAVNGDVPVFSYTGVFDSKENGSGKTVTFSSVALTGAAVNGNYNLQTSGGQASADINRRPITITLTDKSKTYGSIDPEYAATYDSNANGGMGFAGAEDSSTLGNVIIFRQTGENVGTYPIRKFIFNEQNHNYTVYEAEGTFTINKKTLTISNSSVDNKIYDGTTAATNAGGTLVGTKTGDDVTLNLADAVFADANVASGINVTATQTLTGDDAGNYNLTTLNPFTTADITAKDLTISANVGNKTYGSDLVAGTGYTEFTSSGLVNDETVGSVTVAYGDGEAATDAVGTYSDAITISSVTGGTFTAANYNISYETADLVVGKKALTISATQVDKVYGQTLSDGDGHTGFNSAGLENGETIGSVTVAYGTGKADNAAALTYLDSITISSATGGTFNTDNYDITYQTGNIAVSQKQLTVSGAEAQNKTYNNSTTAEITGGTLVGVLTFNEVPDDVSLQNQDTGTFAQATVGSDISVTTAMTLTGDKAGNYSLVQPTLTADITAKELTVTSAVAASKTYDGTTDATISGATLSGVAGGDEAAVTLNDAAAGTFAQAGIGSDINVATAMTLAGAKAANYSLTQPTLSADITAKELTVVNAAAQNKEYDRTTAATIAGAQLSGVLNDDLAEVTLGDHTGGTFSQADVGNDITVTTAMTISGAKAGNYSLAQPSLTANITTRAITVVADAKSKEYGDSDPSLTYQITVGSLIEGDSMSGGLGRDAGEDVGTYAITQGTLTPGGNYDVTYTGADLTVSKRTLTMTADNKSKTYGQTDPEFTVSWSGFVNGDDASDLGGSYNLFREVGETLGTYDIRVINMLTSDNYTINDVEGTFTIEGNPVVVTVDSDQSKVYGEGDPVFTYTHTTEPDVVVNFTGALSRNAGETAGNYAVTQGTLDAGPNSTITFVSKDFVISKKELTVNGATVSAKDYDGTTDATISGGSLVGVINGDEVTLGDSTSGTFADKNIGSAKSVTTAMTISGSDAGNYSLTQPVITGDINAKALTVADLAVGNKIYDRTTDATVDDQGTLNGVVGGESVSIETTVATFVSADVGEDIDVNVVYTLSGDDKNNYTLANQATTADITAKAVTVTGSFTATNRTYDGSTSVAIDQNNLTISGVIDPDTVTLTATAVLADKAAGTAREVALTGSSLGGAQAGNYTLDLTGAPTAVVDIGKKELTLGGGFTAENKVYDATTDASRIQSQPELDAQCDIQTHGAVVVNGIWQSFTAEETGTMDRLEIYQNGPGDANITMTLYAGEGTGGASLGTATFVSTDSAGYNSVDFGAIQLTQGQQYTYEFTTINSGAQQVTANFMQENCAGGTATPNWPGFNDAYKDMRYRIYLSGGAELALTGVVGGDDVSLANHDLNFENKHVGADKTVSLDSVDLDGTDAANYTLTYNSGAITTTADITAKTLTLSNFTASNKTYDGTTDVSGDGFDDDRVQGDGLSFSYDVAFASKVAGSDRTVEYSNISISGGADQNNYTLAATIGDTTADISKASLTVTDATAVNKTYDGNTAATVSGAILSGVVQGDSVSLENASSGTFAQADVAADIAVTTAMTISGDDSANYTLSQPNGLAAAITAKALTISGVSAADKTYDGTTTAKLSGGSLVGVVGDDTVTITAGSGAFASKNIGTHAVTASSYALGGADAGNYTLSAQPTIANAAINAKALTISGVSAADKTYDGTTTATLSGGSLVGVVDGETVTITAGSGAFASKDIGSRAVTASSYALGGADAGNYTLSAQPTIANATINAKALTISGVSAADKTYDGTTTATLSGGSLVGVVDGETVTITAGSGAFASKNIGTHAVTASSYALGGADAGNYTLSAQPTIANAAINAKALTISGVSAADKTYDGTTTATLSGGSLVGVVGDDTVTITAGSGAFASKNIGTHAVTASSYALGGADAGNYTLSAQPTIANAAINAKALTISGVSAADKTYDGTTTATLSGGSLVGVVDGETVTITAGSGAFASKDIGTRAVTASSYALGGADAGNYTLSAQPTIANAAINAKALTISGVSAADKTYDGTTSATLSGGSLVGVIDGETVTITAGSGAFASKDIGSRAVTASSYALGGADAGNYTLSAQPTIANAAINAKALTISGVSAADKTYDGTTTATLSGGSLVGVVDGETVTITAGSGAFASKNIGTHAVTASSYALGGADAGNYTLSAQPTLANATISKAALTVTAAAKSKTYGDDDPALTYSITAGSLISGDSITGALTRTAGEDVGNYAISQGSLSVGGNYAFTFVGADLTIAKRSLTVLADTKSKVYGADDPELTYILFGDLADGDSITGTLTRDSGEDVGIYTINQGSLSASDNYNLSYVSSNLEITKATQTITFASLPVKTVNDSTFSLTATASSGLDVSFAGSDDEVATITGTTVTIVGAGSVTITASQGGNDNYQAGSAQQIQRVINVASGSGTEQDPYVITTKDQLSEIRYKLDGHYQLTTTVDMSGAGWEPIGTEEEPFTGGLSGTSESPAVFTGQIQPLFGYIGAGAELSNITMEPGQLSGSGPIGVLAQTIQGTADPDAPVTINDIEVSGGKVTATSGTAGGLAGAMSNVYIENLITENITVSGSATGAGVVAGTGEAVNLDDVTLTGSSVGGADQVGGVIGSATDSYLSQVSVAVTVVASGDDVGGLVGKLDNSTIEDSVSVGLVTGQGSRVGSIAGYLLNGSVIDQTYVTGNTVGTSKVGGIAGVVEQSAITDSYNEGTVEASETTAGGVAGEIENATLTNVLARGAVTAPLEAGGLVGAAAGTNTVTASYWDTTNTGQAESAAGVGKTSSQLRAEASGVSAQSRTAYSYNSEDTYVDWFGDREVWTVSADDNGGYPYLQAATVVAVTASAEPDQATLVGDGVYPLGSKATVTITPNEGYELASASGCGGLLTNATYRTGKLTTACTISVSLRSIWSEDSPFADLPESAEIKTGEGFQIDLTEDFDAADFAVTLNGETVTNAISCAEGLCVLSAPNPGEYVIVITDPVEGTTHTVTLTVYPQVDLGLDHVAAPGETVRIPVFLDKQATEYPVVVSYQVSGTLAETSHTADTGVAVIESGFEGWISFDLAGDATEGATVVITLTNAENARLGVKTTQTTTVQITNLKPEPRFTMSQDIDEEDIPTFRAIQEKGDITITISPNDPNANDTHTYDWSGTATEIIALANPGSAAQMTFSPSTLTAGYYRITAKVTDSGGLDRTISRLIEIRTECDTESEGCGVKDESGQGVADRAEEQQNSLPVGSGDSRELATLPGLLLSQGEVAFSADKDGAWIDEDSIEESTEALPSGKMISSYNFEVIGLPTTDGEEGQSIPVVLPLKDGETIPENPRWYKYHPLNAEGERWVLFVEDDKNMLHSAPSSAGSCPGVNSEVWQSGLVVGFDCVRITIEDGGPNDADGIVDGIVEDPSLLLGDNDSNSNGGSSSGGGGAAGLWLLWSLLMISSICRRRS